MLKAVDLRWRQDNVNDHLADRGAGSACTKGLIDRLKNYDSWAEIARAALIPAPIAPSMVPRQPSP